MARLASLRVGSGARPTVLLHGFLGSGKNLRALAQRWAERDPGRAFLALDLAGHGASPPLPAEATLQTLAIDVLDTARAEGFTAPLSLVGHSLGGRVALAALREEPASVGEGVLLDIAPGPIDPALSESRRVLDVLVRAPEEAADRRTLRQFLVDNGLAPAIADWLVMNVRVEGGRARWTFDRRAFDRAYDRICGEDLWDVVAAAQAPIRCIRGERSPYVGESDVRRLEAGGCRVGTIPGAGHYVHVDALDALVGLL